MESALSAACRSAEELLSRCIQVRTLGTTTWIDPSTSWENVRKAVFTMIEKKDGVLVFARKDSSRILVQSQESWNVVCSEGIQTASNGGKCLELEFIAPASASCGQSCAPKSCAPGKSCAPSTSCCPQPSMGCGPKACPPKTCQPKASGCCSSSKKTEEKKKVCLHPVAGEFGKPTDCRSSKPEASSGPDPNVEYCMKCPKMYPETELIDEVLPKPVNPTLSQQKYSGEALRACQLPLGPIGGGVIAVAGDGGLRQWQVVNEVNHNGHVPDSFWGIKAEWGSTSVSKVLQSDTWYDETGFTPAAIVTDHIVPPESIRLMKQVPGVPEVELTARYPTAEVDYPNSGLPVDVHMTAYNPCIPLNVKDSCIPAIVFEFEVSNPLSEDVQVTMLNSQQNLVGWDGETPIQNEVYNNSYGGNSNSLLENADGWVGIDMVNTTLVDPNGQHYNSKDGHFCNAVLTEKTDIISSLLQYESVVEMWAQFTSPSGLSGSGASGPSPRGRTWNGALACSRVIPANGKTTFTFILSWHFPYRFTNWSQPGYGEVSPPLRLGNMYANFFKTINNVVDYMVDNLPRLREDTIAFREAMFDTTLPWQLVDSAAGRVSVIRSPTYMYLADGRLYAFEGCSTTGGCCPLNCTHVLNYEQCLAQLWPTLEWTMRDVDLNAGKQVSPNDRLLSRTDLPLSLRPQWMYWPGYDQALSSCNMCVDGEMGGVLKLYREVRFGASKADFDACWPTAKAIMKRWMTHNDQGDGTMKIAQPSTYDTALYGVNTLMGSLYLCGLRAAEEMAKLQGETELAGEYHERYVMGRESLDRKCFVNGKWYTQEVDPEHAVQVVSDSTFVDCLLGQWWGYVLQLGDILPLDHCQSTVLNIFSHNHIDSFNPATQAPRRFYDSRDSGLVIASWPNGPPPPNRLLYTTECAWTGLTHYFASLCIYMGATDVGLKVLADSRNSYDGTRRSPWNEIECGDHYSRPLCAFQLFATASGLTFDHVAGSAGALRLGFNPRLSADKFLGFYIVPGCWGQYAQIYTSTEKTSGSASLKVTYGSVSVASITLPFKSGGVKVELVSNVPRIIPCVFNQTGDSVLIVFKALVEVKAGEFLNFLLSDVPE